MELSTLLQSQAHHLCLPITYVEVKKVVFSMGSSKIAEPDSVLALFYKKYWSMVGDSIIDMVQKF